MRSSTVVKYPFTYFVHGLIFILGLSASQIAIAQPLEAQSSKVASCNFIDTIQGSSGYGKKFEWQSFAKTDALKRADELGASHVVWEQLSPVGAFNGIAVAKAYKCST